MLSQFFTNKRGLELCLATYAPRPGISSNTWYSSTTLSAADSSMGSVVVRMNGGGTRDLQDGPSWFYGDTLTPLSGRSQISSTSNKSPGDVAISKHLSNGHLASSSMSISSKLRLIRPPASMLGSPERVFPRGDGQNSEYDIFSSDYKRLTDCMYLSDIYQDDHYSAPIGVSPTKKYFPQDDGEIGNYCLFVCLFIKH